MGIHMSRGSAQGMEALYELEQAQKNKNKEVSIKPKYPNCPNCGAPLTSSKCGYCTSEWLIDGQYIDEYKPDRKEIRTDEHKDNTFPNSENTVYAWIEATSPDGHVEDMDLFALVDYGKQVKLVCFATNDFVLGIYKNNTGIENYVKGDVLGQLKINVPTLENDVKSVKIYAKTYGDTNFGMSECVHAKLVGYNHFNVGVDLSADFAFNNCVRLCTLTKERISLDNSPCNFNEEIGRKVRVA